MLLEMGISIADSRDDGGPGSGNHNHKGVPGQVGGSAPGNGSRQSVQGKDISRTYKGDKSTKAIIEHQGFGGLPKIVGKKEFDKAVKASKFVAQRTYSASSQEVLDAYRSQLWNGDFYVDCKTGGSQYGQGMYTAANYEGEITEGMQEEMDHYKQLGTDRSISEAFNQTLTKEDLVSSKYCEGIDLSRKELEVFLKLKSNPNMTGYMLPKEEQKVWEEMRENGKWQSMSLARSDLFEKFEKEYQAPSYVETLTLSPDAKIVTYDEIYSIQRDSGTPAAVRYKREFFTPEIERMEKAGLKADEKLCLMEHLGLISEGDEDFDEKWDAIVAIPKERKIEIGKKIRPMLPAMREEWNKEVEKNRDLDTGAFAALLGYDAINAKGHGASGSYTVILNRTKTIFLDDSIHEDAKDSSAITFQQGEDGLMYAIRGRKVIGWVSSYDASAAEREDGGPGSGNFGHEGRPGEVGGSAPSDGSNNSAPKKKEKYAGLSTEGRKVVEDNIKNPNHFGESDEQKEANRKKLISALKEKGVETKYVEEKGFEGLGYGSYVAIDPTMSYDENVRMNQALNQTTYSFGFDRSDYIKACKDSGKEPRLSSDPETPYDGVFYSKSGKYQKDDTPVYSYSDASTQLSDEEIVRFSGHDEELNPDGAAKAESAAREAIASMSEEERRALKNYTSQYGNGSYSTVNEYFINGTGSEETKKAAEHVNAALDHEIGADCICSRGAGGIHGTKDDKTAAKIIGQIEKGNFSNAGKLKDILVGQVIKNDAAMSTSPGGSTSGYGQRPVQMTFKTPADAKAVNITSLSNYGGGASEAAKALASTGMFGSIAYESEVLFKPGTRYRIDDVQFSISVDGKNKKSGKIHIVASILTDRTDGGPGSGNFGHEGRPGEVGGSAPSDGPKTGRDSFSKKQQKVIDAIRFVDSPDEDIYKRIKSVKNEETEKRKWSLIEMTNGQLFEMYNYSGIKEVLKDYKSAADDDGEFIDDDTSIYVEYRDGTSASIEAGDKISELRTSDIKCAIIDNGYTYQCYGTAIGFNEGDHYSKGDEDDYDWRPITNEEADVWEKKAGEKKTETSTESDLKPLKDSQIERALNAAGDIGISDVYFVDKDGKEYDWNGYYLTDMKTGEIYAENKEAAKKFLAGARLSSDQQRVEDYLGFKETGGVASGEDYRAYGETREERSKTRADMYSQYVDEMAKHRPELRDLGRDRLDKKRKLEKYERELGKYIIPDGVNDDNIEQKRKEAKAEYDKALKAAENANQYDPNDDEIFERFYDAEKRYKNLQLYETNKEQIKKIREEMAPYQKEYDEADEKYQKAYQRMQGIVDQYKSRVDKMNAAVLTKYPTYGDIETAEDAEEYLTARGYFSRTYKKSNGDYSSVEEEPSAPSDKSVLLKGMDVDVARQTCETIDKIYTRYPEFSGFMHVLQSSKTGKSSYLGEYSNGSITLNQDRFGKKEEKGWGGGSFHPPIVAKEGVLKEHNSTVAHEMGHALDEWLCKRCPDVALEIWYSTWKEDTVASKLLSQAARNLGMTQTELKLKISGYACKNTMEAFAEAFSELICSDEPRPHILEIGRQIDSLYKTGKLAKKEKKK